MSLIFLKSMLHEFLVLYHVTRIYDPENVLYQYVIQQFKQVFVLQKHGSREKCESNITLSFSALRSVNQI